MEVMYVRSVCFSPDGKYLATGAEDKQIRVGAICPSFRFQDRWEYLNLSFCALFFYRSGTSPTSESSVSSKGINEKSTLSPSLRMVELSFLAQVTKQGVYGMCTMVLPKF